MKKPNLSPKRKKKTKTTKPKTKTKKNQTNRIKPKNTPQKTKTSKEIEMRELMYRSNKNRSNLCNWTYFYGSRWYTASEC